MRSACELTVAIFVCSCYLDISRHISTIMTSANATENYFLVPSHMLPPEMVYGFTNTLLIIVYSFLMLGSLLVNTVFVAILIRRRHRTRTHYLMINLCLSNFYLVLVEMPLQIAWNATVYWAGNDVLCRLISYCSIVGLYGNAFFTVAIALDRWQSMYKTSASKSCVSLRNQRTRFTILLAWIMAHICSIPQAIIFHVEEHPQYKHYYQCVTFSYFQYQYQEILYNLCITSLIYCLPLLALTGCSVAIWMYIRDHAQKYKIIPNPEKDKPAMNGSTKQPCKPSITDIPAKHPAPPSPNMSRRFQDRTMRFRCSTKMNNRLLCRAEKQAFRLTVVFLTIFILCHTPYQIISVWRTMNPALGDSLNPMVHKLLFACGVLPTIVDPVAYAKFLIPITNELKVIVSRRMRSVGQRSRSRTNSPVDPNAADGSLVDYADPTHSSQASHFLQTPGSRARSPVGGHKLSSASSKQLVIKGHIFTCS